MTPHTHKPALVIVFQCQETILLRNKSSSTSNLFAYFSLQAKKPYKAENSKVLKYSPLQIHFLIHLVNL